MLLERYRSHSATVATACRPGQTLTVSMPVRLLTILGTPASFSCVATLLSDIGTEEQAIE